jgi:hypothetical protein
MYIESFVPDVAQAARAARVATVAALLVGAVGALLIGVGAGVVARGGASGSVVASLTGALGCGYVLVLVLRSARLARTPRRVDVRRDGLQLQAGNRPELFLPWSAIGGVTVVEHAAGARRYPPQGPELRVLLGADALATAAPVLRGRSGRTSSPSRPSGPHSPTPGPPRPRPRGRCCARRGRTRCARRR